MTGVRITVSPGELLDRLTIQEIKAARVTAAAAGPVWRDLAALYRAARALPLTAALVALRERLRAVNEAVWEAEDGIRVCMQRHDYGPQYRKLTQAAHAGNDERGRLKAEVNKLLGAADPGKVYRGQP